MRLTRPRIDPLDETEIPEDLARSLKPVGSGRLLNIFATLARAPEALERFQAWGGYVLSRRNTLTPRQREIVILRVGWLCRSGYEFAQHRRIGAGAGLSTAEIDALKRGPEGFERAEAALIRAADDLVRDFFVSDAVWSELRLHFTERQAMDVVFTAGQYVQVSMFLNSFGVQPEDGVEVEPELRPAAG